jgi:glycosyltransferase involved in cell wall biosynthesis
MKKVLFVSYSFPPLGDPESYLVAKCFKYLPRYSWEPHIVCVDETTAWKVRIDSSAMKLLPPNLSVTRVKSFEYNSVMLALAMLVSYLPALFILPDMKIGWYWPAYEKSLSLLRSEQFALIHSWAMPVTSNLVGLRLKKETGLPWVAHFSDPWVDNPYLHFGKLTYSLNARLERAVIENADAIVFVSEETRELVMKKYSSEIKSKSLVIPHCFDPELIPPPSPKGDSRLIFIYTGSFYGPRSPLPLFKALGNILAEQPDIHNYLHVQIVGNLPKVYQNAVLELGIEKIVSVVGSVPFLDCLRYIRDADVPLVIDASSETPSIFLPSKLIDYIPFKKPLLGITPLEGASASLIRRLRGLVVSPQDIAGIEDRILTLYQKFRAGSLSDYSYSDEDIAPYSAVNTAKTLAELFDRVT